MISPINSTNTQQLLSSTEKTPQAPDSASVTDVSEFRKVFHQFVGTTMYGQMLKSMRQTQEKPPYFDGGRAEEIFEQQLDQKLVDKVTETTSKKLSDPMFKLMTTPRM